MWSTASAALARTWRSVDEEAGMTETATVAGRTLGHYAIQRELGRGGMAVVYLAHDLQHGRDVAVKVLRSDVASAVGVERFLQEIRIESALQHPHILPLLDSGTVDGVPYYVMPYIAGETLRSRLDRERQLAIPDALHITRQVGEALGYAHSHGIVHRDIKPENVLLSGNEATVADFGIARAVSAAGVERLTDTGIAVGTPAYMSPEQCGGSPLDGRSDLYSLGCVLYEMLAGEPPFGGRTAQAIVARHMQEKPPSITVVRPTVPSSTVRALAIALAKVPADRFQTAERFVAALEPSAEVAENTGTGRPLLRRRVTMAVVLLTVISLVLWLASSRSPSLDRNRVMVFPLRDAAHGGAPGAGEDVATYIGHVLDGSEPLRWEEGRDWLTPEQRADPGRLAPAEARAISRRHRAGFYVDGSIVRETDSTIVVLRLFDVGADSLLQRAGRSGPSTVPPAQLGALAVGDLLPALLESRRRVDVSALRERRPAAIANFLQGERAYRDGRFGVALQHYQAAVQEDSLFALAAVKGAFSGTWAEELDEVARLAGVAVRGDTALPARYAHFARGLRYYVLGSADSAVAELQRAINLTPAWEEAWMALGEVYHHLLPQAVSLDSLAQDAFRRARSLDREFTPPIYHLFEMAIRADRMEEATRLLDTLGLAPFDSAFGRVAALMLRCARGDMGAGDWAVAAARAPRDVLDATGPLSTGASHRRCAELGLRAVFTSDSASPALRFNALFGLQSLLVQQRRYAEVRKLLGSPRAASLGGPFFFLNDAFADPAFKADARAVVREQGNDYAGMSPTKLWLLGTWEAYFGTPEALAAVETALHFKVDSSGQGKDSTLARIVAAHAAVAAADTSLALERLRALEPVGTIQDITWSLWSSMGLERLMLARLLVSRGEHTEAIRFASVFDSPQPTIYLIFVVPSLALRAQAAQSLGEQDRARRYRARLATLTAPQR